METQGDYRTRTAMQPLMESEMELSKLLETLLYFSRDNPPPIRTIVIAKGKQGYIAQIITEAS